jgi:hypothetical protein
VENLREEFRCELTREIIYPDIGASLGNTAETLTIALTLAAIIVNNDIVLPNSRIF